MSDTQSISQQFAQKLISASGFSTGTLVKAQYCLLDFLTCVFSTQHYPWVQQAQHVARANSSIEQGGAYLLGTGMRVSVQDAAFANAVAGHSLVRDDMHLGSVSHLGVVVVPTALALACTHQVSGKQFLDALVCGYEAGGRLGNMLMDVETAKKIRPTGLIGAFAAAATAARLAGLDQEKTTNALGFAANYITGLNEWAAWGSDDMYFHPGIAARNGITAAMLAGEGARAAIGSLDGKAGLFAALGKTLPGAPALPFSAGNEIDQVFFKQVPACNYAQTAAQVARQVREQLDGAPEHASHISVQVPHASAHYPGCDYSGPFNRILQARMSIHFNVASALLHGDFHDAHFRDYSNPAIAALAQKVTVVIDDALSAAYPDKQGAAITVTETSGRTSSVTLSDVIEASHKEVESRFLKAATETLGEEKAELLMAAVFDLASSDNISDLLSQLGPD